MQLSRRALYGVVALSIALTLAVVNILVYLYLNPDYSWSSSVRDWDGDGVSNSDDVYPRDYRLWGTASATVNVTIVNHYGKDLEYTISCFDADDFGDLPDGTSVTKTMVVSWAYGPEETRLGYVLVRGSFRDDSGYYSFVDIPMVPFDIGPGGWVSVTVTITG